MQNEHEMLGEIIKNARMKADITVEDLAAKVGVGERFIYRIENEGKKPSYDILYKLIRELSIPAFLKCFLSSFLAMSAPTKAQIATTTSIMIAVTGDTNVCKIPK